MRDLKINCPHCEQSLEVPEEMLGQTIECPSCNGSIELPKPAPQSETEPPPVPETKDCPYCGEQILTKAKKCKHCGEILDATLKRQCQAESRPSQPAPQASRPPPAQEKVVVKSGGEGCFLQTLNVGCAIIFIIIAVIVIFVISVANL